MTTADELRRAINQRDLARIDALLTGDPSFRQVLIDDVPLQALAQPGCIPIMELLVRHGADVNGLCWGWFPVLFTPCENLEPEPLQWLLNHGADPNRRNPKNLHRPRLCHSDIPARSQSSHRLH